VWQVNQHGTVLVRYRSGAEEPEQSAGAVERALAMGWGCKVWVDRGGADRAVDEGQGSQGGGPQEPQGACLVDHDGRVNVDALLGAVKGVKGTKMGVEWFCTAEPRK
jgi:hypothetical protein